MEEARHWGLRQQGPGAQPSHCIVGPLGPRIRSQVGMRWDPAGACLLWVLGGPLGLCEPWFPDLQEWGWRCPESYLYGFAQVGGQVERWLPAKDSVAGDP